MCFSAEAWQDFEKYLKDTGAELDIKAYVRLFWDWSKGSPYKFPKAMLDNFSKIQSKDGREAWSIIAEMRQEQTTESEQELFKQRKRLVDAERSLQIKITKKAQNDQRIATDKIARLRVKLDDLQRTATKPRDNRIFPGMYSSVLVSVGGKRLLKPMRYQCRPNGKPSFYDRRYPGTYNARRDNLEGFWKEQFGYSHALMIVDTFFENVEVDDGKNKVLQFVPRTGEPMYVACLWSHWKDPKGKEPDLLSFAAITDEPEPEVAAAGHDRTIINIKPEYIDAWLSPDPSNLEFLYSIFDDKQHPYYDCQEAA